MIQVIFLAAVLALQGWGSHTLAREHLRVLDSWLSEHPNYRVANDRDCRCEDAIRQMRRGWKHSVWRAVRDYHPYQVVGDFNGDGLPDFAVVLVDRNRSPTPSVIAIFNGPFRNVKTSPAFLEQEDDLTYQGLFFGPPRPKPYRLIIGPFESDNSGLLLPAGKTYIWDESDDDR